MRMRCRRTQLGSGSQRNCTNGVPTGCHARSNGKSKHVFGRLLDRCDAEDDVAEHEGEDDLSCCGMAKVEAWARSQGEGGTMMHGSIHVGSADTSENLDSHVCKCLCCWDDVAATGEESKCHCWVEA